MLPQKRHDLISVVIDPRFFAERVMAAGDGGFAVFDLVAAEGVHRVA